MVKKLTAVLITLFMLISFVPMATTHVFAASYPSVRADKSVPRLYQSVNYTITTSKSVKKLQCIIDGKKEKTFTKYTQKNNLRYWNIRIQFTRTGKRGVQFLAYTSSGSKIKIPEKKLYITVKKDYDVEIPSTAIKTGEAAVFTVYTPASVYSLRYAIDGKAYSKITKYYSKSDSIKTWRIPVTFSKSGSRKINFTAYNSKGSRLKAFPSSSLKISVSNTAPKIISFQALKSCVVPFVEGDPSFRVNMANQMLLTLKVCNSDGKVIATLASELNTSGEKLFTWDITDNANKKLTAPPGDYKLKLYAKNGSGTTEKELSFSIASLENPLAVTEEPFVAAFDMASVKGTLKQDGNVSISDAGFYYGLSANSLSNKTSCGQIAVGKTFSKLLTGLTPGATYYYHAYAKNIGGLESKGEVLSFTTPSQNIFTAQDSFFDTVAEEYTYIFNSTKTDYTLSDPPAGYNGSEQAALHMQAITVPVWKLVKGNYEAGTVTIKVHRKLAEAVKAIFSEIYALNKKFPMCSVSSFYYRSIRGPMACATLSKHSFGCAIDINPSYNPNVVSGDPRDKNSPYTVRRDIADIFNKYGWSWGGDWTSNKDYMHFEYLGKPVAGKPAAAASASKK